ncbi:MAG TPA: hypothetical protein VGD17_19165, partial [Chitinophagaceae bacterium]
GIRFIVEDVAHMWTPIEKNNRLLQLEGIILTNRLLWFGVALVVIALTYIGFRFTHRTAGNRWNFLRKFTRRSRTQSDPESRIPAIFIREKAHISVPRVKRTFGLAFHARQTIAIAWSSFKMIATSWAGIAMLVGIPLLTIPVVLDQMESNGVPLLPITARVISELTAPLSDELSRWVIIPFLIVFFAGELVWREREFRLGELTSVMPGSDWAPLLGKFLGLDLVLGVFMLLLMIAAMAAQLIMGYDKLEPGLYLRILFGLQLTDYLLFAVLALVVHVVTDHKYVGHLVAIIAFVFITLASLFGIEHNLLIYGAAPGWSYTQMRGFGSSIEPWLWFKLYWFAWAMLLAVIARLLWVRGKERGFRVRLQLARQRLNRPAILIGALSLVLMLTLGGFIFYNTNVLNEYYTASEIKERSAGYERHYGQFENIPQPNLKAVKLHVEIYPQQKEVDISGTYYLVNNSKVTIDSIHLATVPGVETRSVQFDRVTAAVHNDEKYFHRIYALTIPLQPGDSLRMEFQVQVKSKGFRENGIDHSVAKNGTYFTNGWLPTIGYRSSRELITASDRREYGLAPQPLIASLYDVEARNNHREGIVFEAVIGTNSDQVGVAPGALRRTWTEGGRRYYHYSTDDPIGNEWAFFSADYKIHEAKWKNPFDTSKVVEIRIFHHPDHTSHLDRMVRSIQASLEYYSRQFGPYRYKHLSVVEGPGLGTGMHADAAMISHSEGFTTWDPEDTDGSHDHPYAIVAHEMAHQWTVPFAAVEGAPVMSESIAWYYGMKLVEHARGRGHLQQLLNYMRQPYPYPAIRRGEPLLRGLDPYLSYRRGPFALYALSEYVGDEKVNAALRRLLENHRANDAPLATTLDLYRELQAVTPDSLKYLLHDLFEVNTYWELKTENAKAKQTAKGEWQVTLGVHSRKVVFSEDGVQKEIPMNDLVEVGIFGETRPGEEPYQPIYLQKHRIRSGKQTITVTVPRKPVRAVMDPDHLMVELEMDDNVKEVELER